MTSVSLNTSGIFQANNRRTLEIRKDLATASQELSTGQKADMPKEMGAHMMRLRGLQNTHQVNQVYLKAASSAELTLETTQQTLSGLRNATKSKGAALQSLVGLGSVGALKIELDLLTQKTPGIMGALNSQLAGRAAFSGGKSDTPPFGDFESLMNDIRSTLPTGASDTVISATVNAWFDDAPSPFFTTTYQGSTDTHLEYQVDPDTRVDVPVRGDDPAVRNLLKGLVLGQFASEAIESGAIEAGQALAKQSGQSLVQADSELIGVMAAVGLRQEMVETAHAGLKAEQITVERVIGELSGRDPFEASIRLQTTTQRLETMFAVTAKISQLTLAKYLS